MILDLASLADPELEQLAAAVRAEIVRRAGCEVAADGSWLRIGGREYLFRATQKREIIRVLAESYRSDPRGALPEDLIAHLVNEFGTDFRVRKVFARSDAPPDPVFADGVLHQPKPRRWALRPPPKFVPEMSRSFGANAGYASPEMKSRDARRAKVSTAGATK